MMLVGLLALLAAAAWSAVLAYSAALALIGSAVLLEVNLLKVLRTFLRYHPKTQLASGAGGSSAKQSPASAGNPSPQCGVPASRAANPLS